MNRENEKWADGVAVHSRFVALLFVFLLSLTTGLQSQDFKSADRKVYDEALTKYSRRDYRAAAQQMRRVAARYPKAADPQFWLGMMAVKDGFNVSAIRRYFTRCIELNPDYPHPLAHYYMGLIHYTDDRFEEAVVEMNRYFSLSEGSVDKAVLMVYEDASNYLYWSQFLAEAVLNMSPFEPRRVAGVSSSNNELMPFLSHDGQIFYYLREMPASTERTFYARELERKQWKLYYSKRLNDTLFSKGAELPPPFNSGDPEGSVSLTADGCELYYSVIRGNGAYANSDIYCVRKQDGQWQQPQPCGPQVNGDLSWESQPSISADGKTLVFASNRKGGHGGIDLWRCRRLPNGDWSRAENLGSSVNTAGNEKAPFLAADGHTLYFLSDGWQGFGGYDVYFVNLSDPYGNRPTNLGLPINGEDDAISFGVTTDGRQAYFAAKVDGARSSDVLLFDLYPAARPEPMRLCRFSVHSPRAVRDTLLMLSEQYASAVLFSEPGMLPCILYGNAKTLRKDIVSLSDSLSVISLGEPAVVDALATWLIENPRVHISVECPRQEDARAAYDRLRSKGIRAERLAMRFGTDVPLPRITNR